MRYLIITICLLSAQLATAQNTQYSHARELGFISKPKQVTLHTYEARETPAKSYERAARKPYSTQVITFDDNGRITERVEYYFNTVHYDKDDTVSVTKQTYEYDANNRPSIIRQYFNSEPYTYTQRTWVNDKEYIDTAWFLYTNEKHVKYGIPTEKKFNVKSTSNVWLNDEYKIARTAYTLHIDGLPSSSLPGQKTKVPVTMRPFDQHAIYKSVDGDLLVFDKKDNKGNMTVAVYKTSADKQAAEYLQEEYSYEYY